MKVRLDDLPEDLQKKILEIAARESVTPADIIAKALAGGMVIAAANVVGLDVLGKFPDGSEVMISPSDDKD